MSHRPYSTSAYREAARALAATGRYRIETVPATSHFLPMERPDLVRQVLTEAVGG